MYNLKISNFDFLNNVFITWSNLHVFRNVEYFNFI